MAQVIGIAASTKAELLFHDSSLPPSGLISNHRVPVLPGARIKNASIRQLTRAELSLAEASVVSNSPPMTDYRAVDNDVTLKID